jgi:pimeloyl-[acyl-carrier protein] methyl ester esterase
MNMITCVSGWAFKPGIFAKITQHFPKYQIQLIDLCHFNADNFLPIQQGIDQHIIIGWSLGGLTALQLCNRYPHYFTHLILLASTPRFMQDSNWYGMSASQIKKQLAFANSDLTGYYETFFKLAAYPEKSSAVLETAKQHLHAPHETILTHLLENLFYHDMREPFTKLNLPIMQIIGEKDVVIRPEQSSQANTLVNHTIHNIPKAGHLLPVTHPEQIAALIKDFIC